MQLSIFLVDWPEITFREQAGPLPNDFCNTGTEEGWIEDPPDYWCDSSLLYQAIFTTWLSMRREFDAQNDDHARKSFDMLLGPDSPFELIHPMQCWFLAISPMTLSSVSVHLNAFDFSPISKLFDKHCGESDLDYIESYEDGFLPYMMQWKNAVDAAKKNGVGNPWSLWLEIAV